MTGGLVFSDTSSQLHQLIFIRHLRGFFLSGFLNAWFGFTSTKSRALGNVGAQAGCTSRLALGDLAQKTVLVDFAVQIALTDTEDFGGISSMAIAGLECPPDMLPLRLLQSRE